MPEPITTHGERQARRSRSKGQQIIDSVSAIEAQAIIFKDRSGTSSEIDLMPVLEIIRMADKLRELTRVPR